MTNLDDVDDTPPPCPVCGGIGWVLDGLPTQVPRILEFIACPATGCPNTGTPVEVLAVHGTFARAILGPERAVMSLTGHRAGIVTAYPPGRTSAHDPAPTVPPRPILPPGARTSGPTTS